MVEAFKELPELARIAVDPFLPVKSKANIVNAVLKDSGATEITKRLFGEQREQDLQQQQHQHQWSGSGACSDVHGRQLQQQQQQRERSSSSGSSSSLGSLGPIMSQKLGVIA